MALTTAGGALGGGRAMPLFSTFALKGVPELGTGTGEAGGTGGVGSRGVAAPPLWADAVPAAIANRAAKATTKATTRFIGNVERTAANLLRRPTGLADGLA